MTSFHIIGQCQTTVAGLLMYPSLQVTEEGTLVVVAAAVAGVVVVAVVCNGVCSSEVVVSGVVVVVGSLTWRLDGSYDVVAANVVGVAVKRGAPSCSY